MKLNPHLQYPKLLEQVLVCSQGAPGAALLQFESWILVLFFWKRAAGSPCRAPTASGHRRRCSSEAKRYRLDAGWCFVLGMTQKSSSGQTHNSNPSSLCSPGGVLCAQPSCIHSLGMETASNNNTRPEVTSLRKLKKKKKGSNGSIYSHGFGVICLLFLLFIFLWFQVYIPGIGQSEFPK